MNNIANGDIDKLTRELSQSILKLVQIYADASKSVEETEAEVLEFINETEHYEELRDRLLAMNGIEKPPEGTCPIKDLNDELVEATEARGSEAAQGVKVYMELFRKACVVAKSKSGDRPDRIVRTEDFKEAAFRMSFD